MTIPEQAVQAATAVIRAHDNEAWGEDCGDEPYADLVTRMLTAAAPHLAAVRVNIDEIVQPLEAISAIGGRCRWVDVANAIGEVRRVLRSIEPIGYRAVVLEEAASEEFAIDKLRFRAFHTNSEADRQAYFDAVSKWFQDRHYRRMHAERALHPQADKPIDDGAQGEGWLPIDHPDLPKDGSTVILATTGGHVGEAVPPDPDDTDDDWYWCGAACRIHPKHKPIAWRPLPTPPAGEVA